ncbi:MAG: hypothetical protein U9N59_04885, partial [Campylobacterota bacterium]|nr:hypothetical protein [Campylobacterota bacterium]
MKNLFNLLILLLLSVTSAIALDFTSTQVTTPMAVTEDTDITIYNNEMDTAGDNYATQVQNKYKQNALNNKVEEKKIYFNELDVITCMDVNSLKCPALNNTESEDWGVVTNWIKPKLGQVSCTVYDLNDVNFFNNVKEITSLQTKVFTRKICKDNFKKELNKDTTDAITVAKHHIENKQEEIQQLQLKYEIDFKESGGKKFLDLADWLDALSTVNGEIINIEDTLAQGEIRLKDDFTIQPNEMVLGNFEGNLENLLRYYSGDTLTNAELDAQIRNKVKVVELNKIVSNSKYVMYLDFFTRSSEAITAMINMLFFIAFLWNVGENWVLKGVTRSFSKVAQRNDNIGRFVGGAGIFLVIFSGSTQMMQVQEQVDGPISEYSVKTHRIQTLIKRVYETSNTISDNIARIGITSYLNSLKVTSGVGTVDALDSFASERIVLKKEQEFLKDINVECVNTYNISRMKTILEEYRNEVGKVDKATATTTTIRHQAFSASTVSKTVNKAYSAIDLNPFPTSEREAFAMFSYRKTNPYSLKADGGLLNTNNYDFMNLSGCSANKKKIIENVNRLNYLDKKITDLSEVYSDVYNKKVQNLKQIHEMMWKNYAELGYISIAFLPATSAMIDLMGAFGADEQNIDRDGKDDVGGFESKMATALPMLAIFGGNSVATMVNNLLQTGPDTIKVFTGPLG